MKYWRSLIDVQLDRLEITLVGWSRDGTAYVRDHSVIWGAPSDKETWDRTRCAPAATLAASARRQDQDRWRRSSFPRIPQPGVVNPSRTISNKSFRSVRAAPRRGFSFMPAG